MNRWGKATLVLLLGLSVGACTAAPKKVATTTPSTTATSSSPAPTKTTAPTVVSIGSIVQAAAHTVSVIGTGTIPVRPDTIIGQFGITLARSTPDHAAGIASGLAAGVAKLVAANGGNATDVSTVSTGVSVDQNAASAHRYRANQQIQVRLPNTSASTTLFSKIATFLGANMDAGGYNTSFVLKDDDPFYEQARKAAFADAKDAASNWAVLAGVALGRIQSVTELVPQAGDGNGGYGYQTPNDGSVTINKGPFTFTVRVNVVYAIK